MPESFRGASREPIDPSASPVDAFIRMMQQQSGDPMQLVGMLSGIIKQILPAAPLFVQETGKMFSNDLDLWVSGKTERESPESASPVTELPPAA